MEVFIMKICPNCHKEFDDSKKFCNSCGTSLVEKTDENSTLEAEAKKPESSHSKFSDKTFALITGIFSVVISVVLIASIFGRWIGYSFLYGIGESEGALSDKGLESGNIINIINLILNPSTGLLLRVASIFNLTIILSLLVLSVFMIFNGIYAITKGEIKKKHNILLFVMIVLVFLSSSVLTTQGTMQGLLTFLSFVYIVLFIVKRLFSVEGIKQRILFAFALFCLLIGFSFGLQVIVEMRTSLHMGMYDDYGISVYGYGLFGYIYMFILIFNNLHSANTIPGIYYVGFVLYLIIAILYFAILFLLAKKKYKFSRYFCFAICLLLIIYMIEGSLLNQESLMLGNQIAALIFTLIGSTLLTTYTILDKNA